MKKFLTGMSLVVAITLPTFALAQTGLSACLDKYRHSKNRDSYCYGQIGKSAVAKSRKKFNDLYESKKAAFQAEEKKRKEEQERRLRVLEAQAQPGVVAPAPAETAQTPVTTTSEPTQVRPIRQRQPVQRRRPPQEEQPSSIPYY